MRKHGVDSFKIYEIDRVDDSIADDTERKYIALYSSAQPRNGYNLALGGRYGLLNEASRKKISERMMGNKYAVGAIRSPETRALIAAGNLGKIGSMRGKTFSEDHRRKIGDASHRWHERKKLEMQGAANGQN